MFICSAFKREMADDTDVPPLEDMSNMLEKVLSNRDIKPDNECFNRRPALSSSTDAISDSCTSDERNMASVWLIFFSST